MRNLEAKFRLSDLATARRSAEAIGFVFAAVLEQRDTFFVVPSGKLKLREQGSDGWLIHYHRDHSQQLELSNYEIVAVADPAATRAILLAALGAQDEVRKQRTLLMRRNIRLHLDHVDGLGVFGEIEAVLRDTEVADTYRAEVSEILTAIDVAAADLIDVSYFELIRSVRERSASASR
jgi:predicted adenylyl cyclase CyaB